jgi:hypothetical protein
MKSNLILIAALISLLSVGCKKYDSNNESKILDEIVKDEAIDEVPNLSDEHFDNAIKAYEADNKAEAAQQTKDGVLALIDEGKNVGGLYKVNLDNAIEQLKNIAGKLDNNDYISLEGFKEAIVNAEINIAHEYLSTNNGVYVLIKPEDVKSAITKRHFSTMLSKLKNEEELIKKENKNDRDALLKEGEILEKELLAWEAKANAYSKKTNEHFKIYLPDYHYSNMD